MLHVSRVCDHLKQSPRDAPPTRKQPNRRGTRLPQESNRNAAGRASHKKTTESLRDALPTRKEPLDFFGWLSLLWEARLAALF
jgi:hypothetical protein